MVRFAVKIAGKTGKREQRSGQERAVVGFTTQGTGTSRDGRTGTGQEMHEVCEADGETLGYASLYGNRQKWTCGCSEADRRGPLYASLHRERGTSRDGRTRTG